ncbi:MAG: UDP-N-acetylmuramate dehydrogenase [Nitriliruptoraceae bacterium]
MTDPVVDALRVAGVADVRGGASLGAFTTLRVGGPARALVTAHHDDELRAVGDVCQSFALPWAVIGRGSNLLVADRGWPGVAAVLGSGYRGIAFTGVRVVVGAAEPLPAVATHVAAAGLSGFAWAVAVPGSVGGAVRMNAGAHGGQVADHLVEADIVRLRTGVRETWPAAALGLRYRHSDLPDDAVVVSATLQLAHHEPQAVRAELDAIRAWRRANQPINSPTCGSVFTNPTGDSAGRLIEAAGGKGLRVGGATVSMKHANFIVTHRDASAADVLALMRAVQELVKERFGVLLQPEVVVLGDVEAADGSNDG